MYQNIFVTYRTDDMPATVLLWDDKDGLQAMPYSDFNYAYRRDGKGKFTSLYGDKLSKVKRFDREDPDLFESDVSRETRVLTDLYLGSDEPSTGHRIVFFDIEVRSDTGFAPASNPYQEVTAIALFDQTKDSYYVFLLDPEKKIASTEEGNTCIISCETEVELLDGFLQLWRAIDPTIVTGWNTDDYDIPYLYNRLTRVFGAEKASMISPVGIVKWQEGREKFQIAGVSSLDYIRLYKKFVPKQRASYRLDFIGQLEVKMGKVQYDGTLDDLFKNDLPKFIDYNLTDVKIVVALDKKMNLIELVRRVCHVGHVPYEDFAYSSKFIEGTILTYLHRKKIIAPNKPEGGREEFEKKMAEDSEGFTGAYVRPPFPNLYDWVYSLDLQSLYPSIIMSLNISPETKIGRVPNWDVEKHIRAEIQKYIVECGGETKKMDRKEFLHFLETEQYVISSNGILYSTRKLGIIPEILNTWFKQRVEYKDLMKQYAKEGDKAKAAYYDQMQSVQKVFLNSIYGVLGLSIFRFYDLDNASAVTLTGQDVIKTTAKFLNDQYKRAGAEPKTDVWLQEYHQILVKDEMKKDAPKLPVPFPHKDDHCLYIDTDSVYFSAVPLFQNYVQEHNMANRYEEEKALSIQIAREMETKVNEFYDVMAKMLFNCDAHRFVIKGESVMETGFWVAKKRYAMKKIFDLEKNMDFPYEKEGPEVKGLDVVRSSFPPAFQNVMKDILADILDKKPQSVVDEKVLRLRREMQTLPVQQIAKNTAVKDITKYERIAGSSLNVFPKGAPIHVKASITYNRLLKVWGKENLHAPIKDGDKIKVVYLRENPYRANAVAFKTYDDPDELLDMIADYIDYNKLFQTEMEKKLGNFYDALGWGEVPTKRNHKVSKFF